ncbi:MAG: hypothetical protein ACYC4N_14650 [Pirellulaceae bacterium]
MITPDQALRAVLEVAEPRTPRWVAVAGAIGLRLAEPVHADRDYPPFHRYVSAAILRLGGHPASVPATAVGTLLEPVRANESRPWFVLGRAVPHCGRERKWSLQPLPGHSSADLFGTSHANCYIEVPPGDGMWQVGDTLTFEWLADTRRTLS